VDEVGLVDDEQVRGAQLREDLMPVLALPARGRTASASTTTTTASRT
jgi:hypothetical protein